MLVEKRHPAEGLLADGAGVLLCLQVGLQVRAQVGLVGEGPGAVVAGERLLPGVRPDVSLQQPGPGEGLSAGLAPAGQRVGSDVHLEGGEGGVALGAVLAGEAARDLVAAVELAVLGVARLGGEGLPALAAAVRLVGLAAAALAAATSLRRLLLLLLLLLERRVEEACGAVLRRRQRGD